MSEISNGRELNLVAVSSSQALGEGSDTYGISRPYFCETTSENHIGDRAREFPQGGPLKATYVGVLLFCFFYFFHPQDLVPALAAFPFGKITGLLTGVSLVAAIASGRCDTKTTMH